MQPAITLHKPVLSISEDGILERVVPWDLDVESNSSQPFPPVLYVSVMFINLFESARTHSNDDPYGGLQERNLRASVLAFFLTSDRLGS